MSNDLKQSLESCRSDSSHEAKPTIRKLRSIPFGSEDTSGASAKPGAAKSHSMIFRELRQAHERKRVTAGNEAATAKLVEEGIIVRDFQAEISGAKTSKAQEAAKETSRIEAKREEDQPLEPEELQDRNMNDYRHASFD